MCADGVVSEPAPSATSSMGGVGDGDLDELRARVQEMEDSLTCSICMERKRSVAFLCGHSACHQCTGALKICHMCRKPITGKINLFNWAAPQDLHHTKSISSLNGMTYWLHQNPIFSWQQEKKTVLLEAISVGCFNNSIIMKEMQYNDGLHSYSLLFRIDYTLWNEQWTN